MQKDAAANRPRQDVSLRRPRAEDGAEVWRLVRDCAPLDRNSLYCNMLQCDHFAETCVIAELDGEAVGWVSGYIVPEEPDTLFVWQVAVAEKARGRRLAQRMIQAILERDACAGIDSLKTTITGDNGASWAMFRAFAAAMQAPLDSGPHFTRDDHFEGRHATEHMVAIGPFGALARAAA